MASRRDLDALRGLLAVGEARAMMAKASLAEAERHRSACEEDLRSSQAKAEEAYLVWSASIGSKLLGPAYLLSTADRLLAAESGLVGTRKQLQAAEREAEDRAIAFRAAEAGRAIDADRYSRRRRKFDEGREERQQQDLQEILQGRRVGR